MYGAGLRVSETVGLARTSVDIDAFLGRVAASGASEAAVGVYRRIMTDVNRHLEAWIRERPEQWLWIHRRWKQ